MTAAALLLQLLALFAAGPLLAAATERRSIEPSCSSDDDCSLLGVCSSPALGQPGRCVCDAGWTGADCSRADLLPHRPTDGYINQSAASWGGRPILFGGRWHLFATEIARKCPLILFMNNSMVIRATAADAAGPYSHEEVVLPTFHHNPTTVGPTPDGAKTPPLSHSYTNNDHFTKTGSGQT
jgi:hypothetical protein